MKFLAFVLLPALLSACPQTEEPGETETDASTSATTDPTTQTTTESATTGVTETPATDSAATDTSATTGQATTTDATDTAATDTDTAGPVFPPVQCGEAMCAEGQFCVMPGLACDYGADPPEFYQPDPYCSDVPPACQGMAETEIGTCLGSELCPAQLWDPEYSNGTLECPDTPDCF